MTSSSLLASGSLEKERSRIEGALQRLRPDRQGRAEVYRRILEKAVALGHGEIVREVDEVAPVDGARVLEVGCGRCWYAPLILGAGARSFTGFDRFVDFGERRILDRITTAAHHWTDANFEDVPLSLEEFLDGFQDIRLDKADVVDHPYEDGAFDVAFALTVSEHVVDLRGTFRRIRDLLAPGGRFYTTHGNYYCWHGHHKPPKFVADLDPDDPEQQAVVDWNHIRRLLANDSMDEHLNHARQHEIMEELGRHFVIDRWWLLQSTAETGRDRMTPEIRASLPGYYEEELLSDLSCAVCTRPSAEIVPVRPTMADLHAGDHDITIRLRWAVAEEGRCWITRVPAIGELTELVVHEDGVALGPGESAHATIRSEGSGAYSLWGNFVYFSTSDGSDPNTNGREYELRRPDVRA
jgi:SAM-dependent methyltransferase